MNVQPACIKTGDIAGMRFAWNMKLLNAGIKIMAFLCNPYGLSATHADRRIQCHFRIRMKLCRPDIPAGDFAVRRFFSKITIFDQISSLQSRNSQKYS